MKTILSILLLVFTLTSFAQSGGWIEKSYEVKGTWEIVKKGDTHYLIFDEDFDTKKAPDLKIFLSKLEVNKINADNAVKGSVKIADLKSYDGKQSFLIPKSVNLMSYKTLLIHCQQYEVLWSVAKLNE
jgi:hypothetical protein